VIPEGPELQSSNFTVSDYPMQVEMVKDIKGGDIDTV